MNKYMENNIFKEMNLSTKTEEEKELELYNKLYFVQDNLGMGSKVNLNDVSNRKTVIYSECRKLFPQNIFFINYGKYTIFGRKLISEKHLNGKLKELHCSAIKEYMLLGIFVSYEENSLYIKIKYNPLNNDEKSAIFSEIVNSKESELIYPFRYLDSYGKERHSPKNGWQLNPLRAENLSLGEERIRKFTIDFLKQFDLKNKVVYDPACSTGKFLSTIKQNFPECYTIGQDLSVEMVEYAKNFVDEIHLGNSIRPAVPVASIDFCFIRFLNSEVVTTKQAERLFVRIKDCIKPNGIIIVLGHTPILLKSSFFCKYHFSILNMIAYDRDENAIFQYYVLKNGEGSVEDG